MRKPLVVSFVLLVLGTVVVSGSIAEEAADPELARRIVNVSAGVNPGDVVVVAGGKHTIELMEALAIEVQKAGGMVSMFLNSDQVLHSFYADVPEKYLEQEPAYFAEWLKQIDVWIGLPGVENPKATFGDIPESRFAKAAKAGQLITNMLNESGVRVAVLGYPTEELAAVNELDFSIFEKMYWKAVNADYKRIAEFGNKIREILQEAKRVRVTSANGTDFTFSVGDRPIFVNDGIVTEEEAKGDMFLTRFASLPGGSVFLAPIESSANGRVVVPRDRCRFEPLTGMSFEFKNGKMQNFQAEKGAECFEETLAPYTGPKDMFASFSIGLNPALEVIERDGDYRPSDAAGMVYISVGDNQLLGGTNKTQGGYNCPIVGATVEVDGKVIVKDGELVI